ncbi:MAG: hypothetical protein E2P02_04910 [Acidobacteria bacterium]|nr:MAG: hypothetical protein E2P02_04910 [Acidobacteriota bacterium]
MSIRSRLSVTTERVTQEIRDPDSRNVIGRLTQRIGAGEVLEADHVSAVCTVLSTIGFEFGDLPGMVLE